MARKKPHEEHENHERWLVSYADFITLLFAFFTVLYATSQKDAGKAKEFEESLRRAYFSFFPYGEMKTGSKPLVRGGSPISPIMQLYDMPKTTSSSEMERAVRQVLQEMMSGEEQKDYISEIRHDALGVTISLAASAVFASGSDEISPEAQAVLAKVGSVLAATKNQLVIQGHTDSEPIASARFASNWDLSTARATAIIHFLLKNLGISPERLVAVGFADQRPVDSNETPEGRAKNRRIEILIVTGEEKF